MSALLWQLPINMATTLAPVDSREVLRCDACHLVQFRTHNNDCRRCHKSLDQDDVEAVPEFGPVLVPVRIEAPAVGREEEDKNGLHVARSIRCLRLRAGLSQRQLALRMQVPRTYVSKIENEKAMPTLSSLQRLATALEVSMADLLKGSSRTLEDDITDLMHDEFIAEIIQCLDKLDSMQRSSLLAQVRDLSIRPRRTA